jgi:hypothetical protein
MGPAISGNGGSERAGDSAHAESVARLTSAWATSLGLNYAHLPHVGHVTLGTPLDELWNVLVELRRPQHPHGDGSGEH